MPSYSSRRSCLSLEQALAPYFVDEGLPFSQVLPLSLVEQAFTDAGVKFGRSKNSVFTPAVTLWAFLSQVSETDKSCRAAVSRVSSHLMAAGLQPCSLDTGPYCRARAQLPVKILKSLALETGRNLESLVPADWLWKCRHVSLVDGTTLTMPDTPANQAAYPQQTSQEPGLGFPILRMVVVTSLATACVLDMATAKYAGKETGETALLRQLLDNRQPGEVLLADSYYCSYWLVAMAQARGLDVVFRIHHLRQYDFSRGRCLGEEDHVATWHKPQRPQWMDEATYASLPLTLTVRELRIAITTSTSRTEEVVIATTLTDAATYRKEDVGDLYHERWKVEPDIRTVKTYQQMDHLRCKKPAMIEKELWAHFLSYNLTRKVTCQAALLCEVQPRQVSFTAAKQTINACRGQRSVAAAAECLRHSALLLQKVGKERVGDRPNRVEPRLVKRRPKQYKHLRKPRAQERAEILRKQTR